MTDDIPADPEDAAREYQQLLKLKHLFGLCEAWLAGGIGDDDFRRESLALRKELIDENWSTKRKYLKRSMYENFNMAVKCSICVEEAIYAIMVDCKKPTSTLGVRAYEFSRYASGDVVNAMGDILTREP